ncbi:hypothetical protein SAMN05216371_3865 [Streptomyces sp. TLI_053]|uniref:hypothetical protein n=1 Tax=Streptomyces sp. TLI_053 TaxID=1855352 RepID=UPI00087DA1C4|nr:hypothetical protein [Streptomyces sp. TLI_053]SDT69863.1 hypothetical protein SAMN05216371_3865 [Streptomyces sp. TLI_053]
MITAAGANRLDDVLLWAGALVTLSTVLGLIWRATRGTRHLAQRVEDFVDDWTGVPSRPGVPGRPGVMARLDKIEHKLAAVEHELHPNSGSSLRDAVDRVDQRTAHLDRP